MTTEETPGFVVRAFESIGSTNEEAKALARAGALDGTVVWAKSQTAGRGRDGRNWISPAGNLYLSIVLRPRVPLARVAEIGFAAALGIADVVEQLAPAEHAVRLKWPNDVLVDDAKIAGILLESEATDGVVPWVVVGIGLNVATVPDGLPHPATSLHACGAGARPPKDVLATVLAALRRWLPVWRQLGFVPIRDAWLQRGRRPGELVQVRVGDEIVTGHVVDLDHDGALIIERAGQHHRVTAGDVVLV